MVESHQNIRKLLVLDLDETLVFATKKKLDAVQVDFVFDDYCVYKRPHLSYFLDEVAKYFDLAIWSSAGDIYVGEIVSEIASGRHSFVFAWGRSKCSKRYNREFDEVYYEKRLEKIVKCGYPLEHILIVDDTPSKAAQNYGNVIYISEFCGDSGDNELLNLLDYVRSLKDVENVRVVEKRYWRGQVSGLT